MAQSSPNDPLVLFGGKGLMVVFDIPVPLSFFCNGLSDEVSLCLPLYDLCRGYLFPPRILAPYLLSRNPPRSIPHVHRI